MKLDSIKLTNFRCFEELEVTFEPDVTLIVGVNGAGKTTVLDAVSLILGHFVSGITDNASSLTELSGSDVHVSSSTPKIASASIRLAFSSTSDNVEPGFPHEAELATGLASPAGVFPPDSLLRYGLILRNRIHESDAPFAIPLVAYYRVNRKLQGDTDLGDIFKPSYHWDLAFENALNAGADFKAMCQWLYLAENQVLRESKKDLSPLSRTYAAMQAALKLLVERIKDFHFEGLPPSLFFQVGKNGESRKLTLTQLSDGYRNLIGICLDFARRLALANPEFDNPLELPAILLIDEIELHLHPSWQQTVIPKLREIFPNTQIIATTHSPQVLTSVEERCIRILDGETVHAAPSGTWGAESKRVLEEVLGVSSRPPEKYAKPVQELQELHELIDAGKYVDAKKKIDEFMAKGYDSDPAVIDANLTVENRIWEEANL